MQGLAVWSRIAAHPLYAPTGMAPYSAKLAKPEGWTMEHTDQVIEEYRCCVHLGQISDTEVTPSRDADRAWHIHFTFTRDY